MIFSFQKQTTKEYQNDLNLWHFQEYCKATHQSINHLFNHILRKLPGKTERNN
jgi:hypothetical protein